MAEGHFRIETTMDGGSYHSCNKSEESMAEDSFNTPLSGSDAIIDEIINGSATVFQTSLNMAKMCMGTGTLALPFAATQGGLLFNIIGLLLIGVWNYYSANCLLRCRIMCMELDCADNGEQQYTSASYGAIEPKIKVSATPRRYHSPPPGTTEYGKIAWHASGHKGLMVLDSLMILLFFGLLIAYEVAIMSFIDDIPYSTGSRRIDLLIPSTLIIMLSCLPDVGFLSKFSGLGLMAVALSFIVISWQGFLENGLSGFTSSELNLWPESLSSASSWFGCVVFGYGVVPFIFNFRDSMAQPGEVNTSLQIGLLLVYFGYVAIANGVSILFTPSYIFEGDVLQAMPDTWISLLVRLLMIFVIAVTAPLIAIPCGELVEGKLGLQDHFYKRILVRVLFWLVCIGFAEFMPVGFVHVVSFLGCFCVAMVGFVLPPLFCLQLSTQRKCRKVIDSTFVCDTMAFVVGLTATSISSKMTFSELI